jgi:hypothetical protein
VSKGKGADSKPQVTRLALPQIFFSPSFAVSSIRVKWPPKPDPVKRQCQPPRRFYLAELVVPPWLYIRHIPPLRSSLSKRNESIATRSRHQISPHHPSCALPTPLYPLLPYSHDTHRLVLHHRPAPLARLRPVRIDQSLQERELAGLNRQVLQIRGTVGLRCHLRDQIWGPRWCSEVLIAMTCLTVANRSGVHLLPR